MLDDDDDDYDEREAVRSRSKKGGKKPAADREWASFSKGCQSVRIGIWIEFAATTGCSAILLLMAMVLKDQSDTLGTRIVVQVLAPVSLAGVLVGSIYTAIGRFQMCKLPHETAVGGLMTAVAVVTVVRPTLILVSTVMVIAVVFSKTLNLTTPTNLFLIAVLIGWLTEYAVLVPLGVIGGVVGNTHLRRSISTFTMFLLLVYAAFIALMLVGILVGEISRLDPRTLPATNISRTEPSSGSSSSSAAVLIFVGGAVLAIHVAYTLLQQGVYQAGRSASVRRVSRDDDF